MVVGVPGKLSVAAPCDSRAEPAEGFGMPLHEEEVIPQARRGCVPGRLTAAAAEGVGAGAWARSAHWGYAVTRGQRLHLQTLIG